MSGVYRIQDADGRGPFKPGFTTEWISDLEWPERDDLPPSHVEFDMAEIFTRKREGWHIATAVSSLEALLRWFMPQEIGRLYDLGYAVYCFNGLEVLAVSPNQMIVAKPDPFSHAPRPFRREMFTSVAATEGEQS